MHKLDNPQEVVYRFIVDFYEKNGYPPSIREICTGVGLKSTATVHGHLSRLEEKGLIERDASKQRAYIIKSRSPRYVDHEVPLVGKVAAGLPITAMENVEDAFALPPFLSHGLDGESLFMLRVSGESMVEIGMNSGDLIVVNKDLDYSDGDIVVARLYGDQVTVKRIYREKEQLRLQPENRLMSPIYVAYDEAEVVGKVIGLLRSY